MRRFRELARGFLGALARRETYAPFGNLYFLYGFLWGIPVPLATIAVQLRSSSLPLTPAGAGLCVSENPWQWFFLAHPLLFGVIFGALGTLAKDREVRIEALLAELQVRADTDGMTGLLNQRAFYERVRGELARATRQGSPVTLFLMDLDHFKRINDRFGHLTGDRVLVAVAQELRAFFRPYDLVCRYGGEEFAVVLVGMEREAACVVADRFRQAVTGLDLSLPAPRPHLTVSIGVAQWRPEELLRDWIGRADRRLYAAKQEGRNRVCGRDPAVSKSIPPPAASG